MPSTQRRTADAIVAAVNAMDVDTIVSFRTPDCKSIILPASLNLPAQSNDAYHAQLSLMKSIFTSFQATVTDVVEGTSSAGKETIVLYISARGDTPVGEYKNEYVWKLGFDEGGEKVSEWVEFVDVGVSRDFYPLLKGEMMRRMAAAKEAAMGTDGAGQ
ncbi:hypothetical protein CC86DRAFT_153554 [Ophiobolus disseminans]|uniref:SnoaL-like domain-containing protein n=1 Tax=Ophiobolus disseminans TaxID=1469910 RepID=A0A6A6ZDJ0_9PLEO|nr:hypothetical protein CC86DRAFT_153554 [Ophiobolus disseminans]